MTGSDRTNARRDSARAATGEDADERTYVLLEEFRLTRSVALQWSVGSVLAFFAFAYGLGAALAWAAGGSLEPIAVAPGEPVLDVVALGVVLAAVVVSHEAVHGLAIARYGERPAFGVGVAGFLLPVAYTRMDASYARDRMLVVLLAPLVVLSAVGLAGLAVAPSRLLVVALAANAAGSIGDVWMAAALSRYPSSVRVAALPDDEAGMGIYGDPGTERPSSRAARLAVPFARGVLATFGLVVAAVVAAVIGALAVGSGDVVVGDPGDFWFLLRHEVRSDGSGATVEFGVPLVCALSALGGVASVLVERVRDGES